MSHRSLKLYVSSSIIIALRWLHFPNARSLESNIDVRAITLISDIIMSVAVSRWVDLVPRRDAEGTTTGSYFRTKFRLPPPPPFIWWSGKMCIWCCNCFQQTFRFSNIRVSSPVVLVVNGRKMTATTQAPTTVTLCARSEWWLSEVPFNVVPWCISSRLKFSKCHTTWFSWCKSLSTSAKSVARISVELSARIFNKADRGLLCCVSRDVTMTRCCVDICQWTILRVGNIHLHNARHSLDSLLWRGDIFVSRWRGVILLSLICMYYLWQLRFD